MSSPDVPTGVRVTYRQQFRRCGKAGCARCAPGRPGHGPYWYACWREGGRLHSHYLGQQAPAGAGASAAAHGPLAPTPRAAPDAALRVRTLGDFAVWRGETAIPPEAWTSHRAAALFKCLLGASRHRPPREQASELLWPEAEPEAGAANLRTTIHRLRRVLDGPAAADAAVAEQREREAAAKPPERVGQLIGCAIPPVQEQVHSDQVLLRGRREHSFVVRLAPVPPDRRRP